MNRDADQINDKVSPSVDSPKQDDLMPPSQNDETYQKIEEERDLLVNTNSEMMVLSRDIPSYIDKNEPVSEPVSNTNTSTATVAVEQKMRGTRIKKRARKTVSGLCPDGMDTEKTQIRTRSSSTEWNSHANVQVEKDNDLLPVSKRIEASAGISSDTSRGKNTPPIDSALNQLITETLSSNFGEAAECIGKEINFKQYFVPSHPQDEVTTEQSAGSVTKKKRKEVVPSTVSSPKLLPESTKKDGVISSPGRRQNNLTPSKPVSSAFLNGSDATKTVPRKKETVKSLAASGVNSSSKTYGKPPLKSNTRDRKESSLRPRVTTGKKSSSKLDGELVNKSKQEKSIGQTPKSIFRDVSSESSSGENGFVDSTASTCPPSDLSSSSDSSEDAATTGRDGKVKGGVKKGVSNSEISGQGHIPIGTILKVQADLEAKIQPLNILKTLTASLMNFFQKLNYFLKYWESIENNGTH
ncbi:hypothetical protein Leryth_007117 [Lithospermum erythrorhizon]|nr:hypothetical protein Leryth_007117 [Lithospermum erythrorhizon]